MAIARDNPYGAFNFQVSLDASVFGGFSDVSGIGLETNYCKYREGSTPHDSAHKTTAMLKCGNVVLKRGLVDSAILSQWLEQGQKDCGGRHNLTIALLDEARKPAVTFHLRNAQPGKWVGPTLAAKGGGEVVMEELHLEHEGISCKEVDSSNDINPHRAPDQPLRKP